MWWKNTKQGRGEGVPNIIRILHVQNPQNLGKLHQEPVLLNSPLYIGLVTCSLQGGGGMGRVLQAEGTAYAKACGCWSPGNEEEGIQGRGRVASEPTGILMAPALVLGWLHGRRCRQRKRVWRKRAGPSIPTPGRQCWMGT